MSRIGLALSGGGFRATLYHLGVLRFLRDAGALERVSHITSVSGGSITAAHVVVNWDRYTGSDEDFDQAANELLDFIRMDVRNRVVRRFPLAAAANTVRRLVRAGASRRLTRPGLLEGHYEKYLFGDKCLYELPLAPQLHMLATNVNEGCLCSFTRRGLLVEHRMPEGTTRFEPVPSALATLPMAVTASSAFPGFFPPLRLTAADVGAEESQFAPHVFTDGGVYDNLGVRMFRHIQQSWIVHDSPLREDDFIDASAAATTLEKAHTNDSSSLARLAQLVQHRTIKPGARLSADSLPDALWNVIDLDRLYSVPEFAEVAFANSQSKDLMGLARSGRQLDRGDHLRLNRCIACAAYRDATGNELLSSMEPKFEAVIVSDAGKQFSVSRRTSGSGLIGTAIRASDIVMDRVWQLECDNFHAEPDFIFAPMKMSVHLSDDPTALHPEIQHQVTNTRTDLDRFSDLEISGLIRHGYGVMRKVCRSHPELFGDRLPAGPPWDPTSQGIETPNSDRIASPTTRQARQLQESSQRQIFSRLLSLKDWPTYVYIPLLALTLIGLPLIAYNRYQISHRSKLIVDAITFSNPDFQLVLQLARQNPVPGEWDPLPAKEVPQLEEPDFTGFRLITDTRVLDARAWVPNAKHQKHQIVSYRRMLVRRIANELDDADSISPEQRARFRIQQFNPIKEASVRSSSRTLNPLLRVAPHVRPSGETGYMYEAEFDLSSVPTGDDFEIGFEVTSPGVQGRQDRRSRLTFPIVGPTDVATMWVLLPEGMPYRDVEIASYRSDRPSLVEMVDPTYRFDLADGSLFGWMLVAPREDHTYECRWSVVYD